jgi:hypothetical protein
MGRNASVIRRSEIRGLLDMLLYLQAELAATSFEKHVIIIFIYILFVAVAILVDDIRL